MPYAYRVSNFLEFFEFSAISKDHLRRVLFLISLGEFRYRNVCYRIFRMIEESDKVTLEGLENA
ncbi:unnamed protein product [Hymenolepis diminuta]|uniref:Uncharacterized protein n=1 Tax=Hymenolepis diminuta TaxID=6216 RepID=A0A564YDV1_HYMDI|nr:unnamed protein product [Hymenolepis diminuta]